MVWLRVLSYRQAEKTSGHGNDFGQIDKDKKVPDQPFDDQVSGHKLFEDLKTICFKKLRQAIFRLDTTKIGIDLSTDLM